MHWTEMRLAYPAQWLVIELLENDRVEVIELCADGCAAKHRAWELGCHHTERSFCFVHTSYPQLSFDRTGPIFASAAAR